MEVYLVYEFTYKNFDEDIEENIEFFGIFKNQDKAIEKANERIKIGLEESDVIIDKELENEENPFSKYNSVSMYRDDYEEYDPPIYSIKIEKLKIQ